MSGDVDIGPDVDDALFAAAFELAAEGGWRRARMVDIAARAGVSADQARARFRCKISLLNSFAARVDAAVETAASGGEDLTPRDRLFDLLMARFDAMTPHRAGIVAILRALPTMPLTTKNHPNRIIRTENSINVFNQIIYLCPEYTSNCRPKNYIRSKLFIMTKLF